MAKPKRTWVFDLEVTLKSGVIITRRMPSRALMLEAYYSIFQQMGQPGRCTITTKRGLLALCFLEVASVSTDAWMTEPSREIPF